MPECCSNNKGAKSGLMAAIISGILPHSFCILFIIFGGSTAILSTFIGKYFILSDNFFILAIIVSIICSLFFSILYLRKNRQLNLSGIKLRKKYLLTMLTVTLSLNLFMYYVVMPAGAKNFNQTNSQKQTQTDCLKIKVDLPCEGHVPLVIYGLQDLNGVINVSYEQPDIFKIDFDRGKISENKILGLPILKEFKTEKI